MRLLPLTHTRCLVSVLSALAVTGMTAEAAAAKTKHPRARAAATASVSSLQLINADTDKPMTGYTALQSGITLDLAKLPTVNLNVAAIVSGKVGSVVFYFDGKKVRTQNSAPYSFASDSGTDYYAWTPPLGTHTIKAVPYSGANLSGTAGTARSWSFTVVKTTTTATAPTTTTTAPTTAPTTTTTTTTTTSPLSGQSVSTLSLINADTDQPVAGYTALTSGATLDLGTLPTSNLNIAALTSPSTVGSVGFEFDGTLVRTQNSAPYTFAGDSGTDYYAWTPALGTHTIKATPYTGANLTGTAGLAKTFTFTVTKTTAPTTSTGTTAPTSGTTTSVTPTPTPSTRTAADSALLPFSLSSPWNAPIAGSAAYGAATETRTSTLINSGGTYINAGAYSIPVFIASASDPLKTISSPEGSVTIRVPSNATAANGTDGNFTIVDPTHTYVDEFWIYDAGTGRAQRHIRNDITNGTGMSGGIRASGFSVMGGLIRKWEVDSGVIDHALEMTIPAAKAKKGYVWPAISEDAYASQYGGTIPLGTRFAIPRSVDVTALGLSSAGVVLARALQTYGAYVGDTSAPGTNGNMILCAEPSLEGTSALSNLRNDLGKLRAQLRVVG